MTFWLLEILLILSTPSRTEFDDSHIANHRRRQNESQQGITSMISRWLFS